MNEETDLARRFTESAEPADGDAFAERVRAGLARRRQLRMAIPLALIAGALLAMWATWPAAKTFAVTALGGVDFLAQGTSAFFNSDVGTATAGAVALSLAIWAFATGRLRGFFR